MPCPNVSKEFFLTLFPTQEKIWNLLNSKPANEHDFITNYLSSRFWRLNNLYTVVDKFGIERTFTMNWSQLVVYAHQRIHPRLIILKSRQQGISTLELVEAFDDTVFTKNVTSGLMAQDQDAASALLERVKFIWDRFDSNIKTFLNRAIVKDNAGAFTFNNGSNLIVATSFRSRVLQRLHISEFGKIANLYPKKAKETKTGSLQAIHRGKPVAIESTAEGENIFKDMWDDAVNLKLGVLPSANLPEELSMFQKMWDPLHLHKFKYELAAKDFMPVFLSWLNDPNCIEPVPQAATDKQLDYFQTVEAQTGLKISLEQRNFWIVQYRELGESIYQEYPSTPEEAFLASKDGTFYAKKYIENVIHKNQKKASLYDPNLPVYVAMDLGRNDSNVLIFFQYWEDEYDLGSLRIVGEYVNSGEGLRHYANYLKDAIVLGKGWSIKEVALPHDAIVVDLSAEGGETRQDLLESYGVKPTVLLSKASKQAGIEAVRSMLPNVWIDSTCAYMEGCFLKYSKAWNDNLGTFKNDDIHDDWSHGADAIRYMVQYVNEYLVGFRSRQMQKRNVRRSGVDL